MKCDRDLPLDDSPTSPPLPEKRGAGEARPEIGPPARTRSSALRYRAALEMSRKALERVLSRPATPAEWQQEIREVSGFLQRMLANEGSHPYRQIVRLSLRGQPSLMGRLGLPVQVGRADQAQHMQQAHQASQSMDIKGGVETGMGTENKNGGGVTLSFERIAPALRQAQQVNLPLEELADMPVPSASADAMDSAESLEFLALTELPVPPFEEVGEDVQMDETLAALQAEQSCQRALGEGDLGSGGECHEWIEPVAGPQRVDDDLVGAQAFHPGAPFYPDEAPGRHLPSALRAPASRPAGLATREAAFQHLTVTATTVNEGSVVSARAAGSPTPANELPLFAHEEAVALMKRFEASGGDEVKRSMAVLERLSAAGRMRKMAHIDTARLPTAEQFPNFADFLHWVSCHAALSRKAGIGFQMPPVLLLGPPGIGKTEVALSLAESLGHLPGPGETTTQDSMLRIDMASAQSASALTGSEEFWANSKPGRLFDTLVFGAAINPIVVLDELDKANASQYSPVGGLYPLLESRTARRFFDLAMPGLHLDASHVIWIATANDVSMIDSALLSRFTQFDISAPTAQQMPTVVRSIYAALRSAHAWGSTFAPELEDRIVERLAQQAPRNIRKVLLNACGAAALNGRSHLEPGDISQQQSPGTRRMGFF